MEFAAFPSPLPVYFPPFSQLLLLNSSFFPAGSSFYPSFSCSLAFPLIFPPMLCRYSLFPMSWIFPLEKSRMVWALQFGFFSQILPKSCPAGFIWHFRSLTRNFGDLFHKVMELLQLEKTSKVIRSKLRINPSGMFGILRNLMWAVKPRIPWGCSWFFPDYIRAPLGKAFMAFQVLFVPRGFFGINIIWFRGESCGSVLGEFVPCIQIFLCQFQRVAAIASGIVLGILGASFGNFSSSDY